MKFFYSLFLIAISTGIIEATKYNCESHPFKSTPVESTNTITLHADQPLITCIHIDTANSATLTLIEGQQQYIENTDEDATGYNLCFDNNDDYDEESCVKASSIEMKLDLKLTISTIEDDKTVIDNYTIPVRETIDQNSLINFNEKTISCNNAEINNATLYSKWDLYKNSFITDPLYQLIYYSVGDHDRSNPDAYKIAFCKAP